MIQGHREIRTYGTKKEQKEQNFGPLWDKRLLGICTWKSFPPLRDIHTINDKPW